MARRKESIVMLDTHIVVWLYDALTERLSKKAKELIERNDLYISSMVRLELQYLFEIEKIKDDAATIIKFLNEKLGLKIMDSNFIKITEKAIQLTWTRDPFDRIIVADAILNKSYLITADKLIRKHYEQSYC